MAASSKLALSLARIRPAATNTAAVVKQRIMRWRLIQSQNTQKLRTNTSLRLRETSLRVRRGIRNKTEALAPAAVQRAVRLRKRVTLQRMALKRKVIQKKMTTRERQKQRAAALRMRISSLATVSAARAASRFPITAQRAARTYRRAKALRERAAGLSTKPILILTVTLTLQL